MFTKEPKRIVNGIYDYIGEDKNEYVDIYEKIWSTFNEGPSLETQTISNCCEILINNYQPENKDKKLIDIGCGFGYVINHIPLANIVAVDISMSQLEKLKDYGYKRIRTFSEDIPIEDSYFDIIICTDVFEHVENVDKLSDELHRLIKPGGMLLFATPWEQDLSVYHTKEYREKFMKFNFIPHLRSVNNKTIEKYFEGFDIVSSTFITVHMKEMTIKPYPIIFIQFIRKD